MCGCNTNAVNIKSLPAGPNLPAPFPWWGGKAKAAPLIWALGGEDVQTVVDPFGGSATALIRNPYGQRPRTIYNDLDGLLTNAQRCLAYAPDETAEWADRPTNHLDLIAIRRWLAQHRDAVTDALAGDINWHWPQAAGYWLWAMSNAISMEVGQRKTQMPNSHVGKGCAQQVRGGQSESRPHIPLRGNGVGVRQDRQGFASNEHGGDDRVSTRRPQIFQRSATGVMQQRDGYASTEHAGVVSQAIPMILNGNAGRGVQQTRGRLSTKHGGNASVQMPKMFHEETGTGVQQQRKGHSPDQYRGNDEMPKMYSHDRGQGVMQNRKGFDRDGSPPRRLMPPDEECRPFSGDRLRPWFNELSRLMNPDKGLNRTTRRWYILCKPWRGVVDSKVVLGQTPSSPKKWTYLILDPPYDFTERGRLYDVDNPDVAAEVVDWLLTPKAWGGDVGTCTPWEHPRLRIVLCGYDTDESCRRLIAFALSGNNRLSVYRWKRGGGMELTGKRKGVRRQEIIIANGNCLSPGEASDG